MRPFSLFRPDSLASAAEAVADGSQFKAGGIDLLDRMKERIDAPEKVVDLMALRGQMNAITADGGAVTIGALATLAEVADAEVLSAPHLHALTSSAGHAATPQIRSRATVGGNLLQMARCWYLRNGRFACAHSGRGDTCLAQEGEHRYHAVMETQDCIRVHPSNLAPPLLVLDAEVSVRDAKGNERTMPLRELYPAEPTADNAENTLAAGEILTAVRIPAHPTGTQSAYRESREKMSHDWATTAAAVRLRIEGGTIADAAIVLGAVAPNPVIAERAAAALVGAKPGREAFAKAAETAYAGADPLDQNAYKVPVGKAVLIDALTEASTR